MLFSQSKKKCVAFFYLFSMFLYVSDLKKFVVRIFIYLFMLFDLFIFDTFINQRHIKLIRK